MKKFFVPLLIATPILLIGSYFGYNKWVTAPETDAWGLVPQSASVIYESDNIVAAWNNLLSTAIWGNFSSVPAFSEAKSSLEQLDSLSGKSGNIDKLVKGRSFMMSAHVTKKDDFDFLFYIDLSDAERQNIAFNVINKLKKDVSLKFTERVFQKYTISEIVSGEKGEVFSYLIYKNYFVGSFTPFLVEDVIRTISNNQPSSFKADNPDLFTIQKLKNDDGDIYINFVNFASMVGCFLDLEKSEVVKDIGEFSKSSFLDLNINENIILMNGFSKPGGDKYVNSFVSQKPQKVNVKHYTPNDAAYIYYLTFSDAKKWFDNLNRYWESVGGKQVGAYDELFAKFGFDHDRFVRWLSGEVSLVVMESDRINSYDKLMLLKADDINEALNQMNTLAERSISQIGDTLYYESFADIQIKELSIENFPSRLFGDSFSGFEQCFYTALDNYLVFANSIETIKSLISDIEDENTWGKSVEQNHFLASTLEEANVSLIFNINRGWDLFTDRMAPEWKAYFSKYNNQFKHLEMGAVQISNIDNSYYMSVALQHHNKVAQPVEVGKRFENQQLTYLESPAITKPYVVKNHKDNSREIIIQDSLYNLYLIGKGGKILWNDSIGERIVSDIEQIDYFKNGKLQYFFATSSTIHLIDRNGNDVEGYPNQLDDINIQYASVIDYDNSKNYRYLVADQKGNLYMFNKQLKNLDGWAPKKVGGKLAVAPWHVRVRGKDCIIALQQDGNFNVFNRRGELMKGFPVALESKTNNPMFVEIGASFKNTFFYTVTNEGLMYKINLDGNIIKREQLYKPDRATVFNFVPEGTGKTFVVVRQSANRLSIINRKEDLILEKDYLSSDDRGVQYYDFGSDRKVYAVTDGIQDFTYIYNESGKLINSRPLNSGYKIGLMYFERAKKFYVYSSFNNEVGIYSF